MSEMFVLVIATFYFVRVTLTCVDPERDDETN